MMIKGWPTIGTVSNPAPAAPRIGRVQRFEQNLRRLVAINEIRHPTLFSAIRGAEFQGWFLAANRCPWDWKFEADIDVMHYAIYVGQVNEAIRRDVTQAEEFVRALHASLTWEQRQSIRTGHAIYAARQKVERCNGKRYAALLNAKVAWASLDKIDAIYEERRRISEQTGIPHHVDHIVPLQGKFVCGLHVEANLRVIPVRDNLVKNNSFPVDKS